MRRERKAFVVFVDLDPTPGMMHTEQSAQDVIRNVLYQRMPHYNPEVISAPPSMQKPNNSSEGITQA